LSWGCPSSMDLAENGLQEEVPIFNMASQEYRHEYSGHRRQKVFNDSVHGGCCQHTGLGAYVGWKMLSNLASIC
jgi:hypothetical protein